MAVPPLPASMNALTAFKRDITPMTPQPLTLPGQVDDMLDTMAWTMLGEAANQGPEGLAAIGHVIVNRGQSGRYSADLTKVAKQRSKKGIHQFSAWNSPAMSGNAPHKTYPKSDPRFKQAREIAKQVVMGVIPDPTGGATHYWAPGGMPGRKDPYWAKSETGPAGRQALGDHIFLPKHPVPPRDIPNPPQPAVRPASVRATQVLNTPPRLPLPAPLNLPPIQRSASLGPPQFTDWRDDYNSLIAKANPRPERLPGRPVNPRITMEFERRGSQPRPVTPVPQGTAQPVPQRTASLVPQQTIVGREPRPERLSGRPFMQAGPALPAMPAPLPRPHTDAIRARSSMAAIPETEAERMFKQSQFGLPPLPRPRPQFPPVPQQFAPRPMPIGMRPQSPLAITIGGGNRQAPTPAPRLVRAPAPMTPVNRLRSQGYSPADAYAAANQQAQQRAIANARDPQRASSRASLAARFGFD